MSIIKNFMESHQWEGITYSQAERDQVLNAFLEERGVALMIDFLHTLKLELTKECSTFQYSSWTRDSDIVPVRLRVKEHVKKWTEYGNLNGVFEDLKITVRGGRIGLVIEYDSQLDKFHDLEFARQHAVKLPSAEPEFFKFMKRWTQKRTAKKSETTKCFLLMHLAPDLATREIYMLTRVNRLSVNGNSDNIVQRERDYVERHAVNTALMGPDVEAFGYFRDDHAGAYFEARPGMFVFDAIKTEEEVFAVVDVMDPENIQSFEHKAIINFMLGR